MNQPHVYKAYHQASHTVSKTRQLVMLYDGAIRFVQQAVEAIEKKDYETRYHKLSKVSDIIISLQACLDFNQGGNSAKILYDFYAMLDAKIFTIHRTNDVQTCAEVIAKLKDMRDFWHNIDCAGESVHPSAQDHQAAFNAVSLEHVDGAQHTMHIISV